MIWNWAIGSHTRILSILKIHKISHSTVYLYICRRDRHEGFLYKSTETVLKIFFICVISQLLSSVISCQAYSEILGTPPSSTLYNIMSGKVKYILSCNVIHLSFATGSLSSCVKEDMTSRRRTTPQSRRGLLLSYWRISLSFSNFTSV